MQYLKENITNYKNIGIVVIDVGLPKNSYRYGEEKSTNDAFVSYLNQRLHDLKKQGAKIIEINYVSPNDPHPLLDIDFDLSTLSPTVLKKYIKRNNIEHLIYTGFHYPICTNNARELSSYKLRKNKHLKKVSIAVQLTRSRIDEYTVPLADTYKYGVWQVML